MNTLNKPQNLATSLTVLLRTRWKLLSAAALLCGMMSSQGTTFTWTTLTGGNASGSWTNQINWDNTLPTTTSDTVNFSTLDITANSLIGLTNGNVTLNVNSMIFGDTDTSTPAGWTLLSSGSAMSLTLGGTNPKITVNALGTGAGVTNNVVMAGSAFVKDGPGLLSLNGSAANTFTGTTLVTNGSLVLNKSDFVLAVPGDLVIAAGASVIAKNKAQLPSTANLTVNGTFDTGSKQLWVNSLVLDSNGVIASSSSSIYLTNNTTFDFRSGSVAPNLAGSAGITKTTSGTVVLQNGGGANVFTGPVLVSDGILDLGHSGVAQGLPNVPITVTNTGVLRLLHDTELNASSTVNIDSGTFELAAHNDTASVLILDHGGMILNSNNTSKTLTINTSMDFRDGTCASKLGGTGSLTKSTAGKVILSGDNAYSGGTTISAGIVQLGDGTANRGLLGSGTVQNDSILVLNHGAGSYTIANTITGNGSLTNLAGTPTLTAANSYSAGTTVMGGTLFVGNTTGSGTGSGAVTVLSGAGLSGTGIISGVVTIQSGGKLSPGSGGIGTLSINGALTMSGNPTNFFEVNGTTPTNDLVVLGSSVTYAGTLNIVPSGAFIAGQQFVLFSGTGATNASNFASLTGSPGANMAFTFTNGVLSVISTAAPTLNFSQAGNALSFSWTDPSYKLQSQTNSLTAGLGTNWVDYPGGNTSPVSVNIDPSNGSVFFRLSQ